MLKRLCNLKISFVLIGILILSISCENYNLIDQDLLEKLLFSKEDVVLSGSDFNDKELSVIKNLNASQKNLKITYTEKIYKAGFEFEEHKVLTEDGYILSLWRIPRRIGEKIDKSKIPVVLQHGLLDDSWTWFALNSSICLPFMLGEENYDVWIPNSRGNMFSNEHINPEYDSNKMKSKYWNYTWHEMAKYDLPAISDYIKKITNFDKIKWVGHSQGTMQFYLSYTMNDTYMESTFDRFASIGTVVTVFNSVNLF